jgi:hypothetical protein
MSEENPGKEEIKESINKLAKKMEQKIIEDARLKIESGFAEEPTTEAYWKEQREKTLAEAEAAYIYKRSLPQDPGLLNFVDLDEAELKERVNALFPPYVVDEMSFAPGSINGWIRLDKHLDDIRVLSDLRHNHMLEIHHLKVTNRVLTILLIFSTAFGITAALAWLRCQ